MMLGAEIQVLVATKPVDFRNYVERTIMRSPRQELLPAAAFLQVSFCIIRLASGRCQHGQQLIGRAEPAGLQHRRRHGGKRLEFLGRIGTQVDLGALQAGVSEPERDLSNVAGCLQRVHGTRVPQHMRTDGLAGNRWHSA